MRSQNRARERSRLHHATLASNSPPPTTDVSPQESVPASATAGSRPTTTKQASPLPSPSHSVPTAMSPSYPFPPMRSISSASIGASFNSPGAGPLDKLLPSGTPTPASVAFHPPGSQPASTCENPEFPSPNMYELTLLLHSEPGIEAFWSNVVNIATTCYKAERVTLAVPSDSTDLENTPWGQKATFNVAEDDRLSLTYMADDHRRVGDQDGGDYSEEDDGYQGVAIPKEKEPPPNVCVDKASGQLDMRDEMDEETDPVPIDISSDAPFGPVTVDWVSVTSGISPNEAPEPPPPMPSETETQERQERAFRIGESDAKGRVFPMLQPLNYEADALLDETGVSRVLQRGKTVVLSREYRDIKTHLEEKQRRRKDVQSAKSSSLAKLKSEEKKTFTSGPSSTGGLGKLDMPTSPFTAPSQPPTPLFFAGRGRRRGRKMQLPKDSYVHNPVSQYYSTQQHLHHVQSRSNSPTRYSSYEEYEQPISSPWSQSPAPSPAPRPDPSENPFFTTPPKVDEETFNPATVSPIYSAQEPVNAIGCESSWTVIHIPLVHPSQSKGFNLDASSVIDPAFTPPRQAMFDSAVVSLEDIGRQQKKKAPIAILSMLSPVIPYPSNLIHSLSHFAPLVATAFSLASSHTNILNQLNSLRKMRASRRPIITRQISYMSDMQSQDTIPGSITSPSESSSAFTISNVASPMSEQPGGVPLHGTAISHRSGSSQAATPLSPLNGGSGDSYFTRIRQPIFSRQSSGAVPTVVPKGVDPESYTSLEARLRMGNGEALSSEDGKENIHSPDQVNDQPPVAYPKHAFVTEVDDMAPSQAYEDKGKQAESNQAESNHVPEEQQRKPRKRVRSKRLGIRHHHHSYLHSYGADYASTFQYLSTSSSVVPSRKGSKRGAVLSDHEMPPPSNRLLRTITDSIPVHVFTAVPDSGRITWVNARMLAYRGISAEQFLKSPWEALHPDDRDEYLRRWGIAIRKGEPFSHQTRVRRFDGDYRWFMVRAVPLRDPRGIIVHWFGTNMDIHDQRLAEVNAARQAEMAESEQKYRSLANSSPQIVFAATASHGITFANTQWLSYSGQTEEQVLKLGFMEHVHPADRPKCCLPGKGGSFLGMSDAAKFDTNETRSGYEWSGSGGNRKGKGKDDNEKPTHSTEIRLKDKHNNYRWHLVRCVSVDSRVDDKDGLWFGTCTDINDHKLLEQKLKEANEAAQRTMDSKTRFLANMSHEIRTPLIGISGMVTFLLDTPLNGEQLDYCHTISQSSDGLLSVINDILDLSKVEAGMMRLNAEWFRMNSLIEDAHELLSTMAIAKDLELNFIVETDVPPVVCGDRVRLRQVLLNIIGNAIKFTSTGEVFSRCSVVKVDDLKEDEVQLQFECHDTGPGFDTKDQEYMFKPFSQIDGSSTRAHGGSGLGLVISRQLVELHGGKLTATSEKGKGSTFIASAKFKVPKTPSEHTATPGSSGMPSPGTREYMQTAAEHILESERFVNSPPGLTYTDGTNSTTVSPSTNHSIRSIPSASTRLSSDSPSDVPLTTYSLPSRTDPGSMRLSLPNDAQQKSKDAQDPHRKTIEKRSSVDSELGKAVIPPMLSILVVSEQPYSRIAISHHIKVTLPKNIPSQITCATKFSECQELITGEHPVVFTHVVISLPDHSEIITLISHLLKNPIHSQTTVLVLTNPTQRTAILQHATDACDKLATRLQFIYKPIKPSRFGDIFDPTKERDASMDRYRDSAQQVVETQKRVFSRLEHEVGNKGYKVLLVEDNSVNQKVLLRFLDKVGLQVETASDGEECVEKVFSKEPGHYGLILCDLHMPRKDGFQATAEIRRWEDEKGAPHVPIVALSANVMSDVADKCALAGFSRYVTKPVNFGELSMTIKELLPSTGTTPPGSPETGDREIERLKEKDKRDRIEAEARRQREAEAEEAEEAAKTSGADAEPLSSPSRTWPEIQREQQDERIPQRGWGRER
ncbi:hypothetical protein K440DRAFT_532708 [Wilcoxina mikolae CBS 423.85]|nr:hypothetical protein K440DRAFT_532708 [Wilcoxina mikolae CBS 423.85]